MGQKKNPCHISFREHRSLSLFPFSLSTSDLVPLSLSASLKQIGRVKRRSNRWCCKSEGKDSYEENLKDMEAMVRKMERYVNSTANLYGEMEVLSELEQATKKFQLNQHEESRRAFEQKLVWQKQDVRHLKDVLLLNQT